MSRARLHPGLNLGQTDAAAHEAAEEKVFGFWIFLMTDLVVFAMLFATYASMSVQGIAGGPGPADVFDLRGAFIETMLLLSSTFTFGMASLALKYKQSPRELVFWLVVTFALGAGFVGHEAMSLTHMATALGAPPQRSGFLSAFWLLVCTHGLHVTAAALWILHSLVQIRTFGLVAEVKLRIMRLALFWHMLDLVWVGIFTFVFLYGLAQ